MKSTVTIQETAPQSRGKRRAPPPHAPLDNSGFGPERAVPPPSETEREAAQPDRLAAARAMPNGLARIWAFYEAATGLGRWEDEGETVWLPDAKRQAAAMREMLAEAETISAYHLSEMIFSLVAQEFRFVPKAEHQAAVRKVVARARAIPDEGQRLDALLSLKVNRHLPQAECKALWMEEGFSDVEAAMHFWLALRIFESPADGFEDYVAELDAAGLLATLRRPEAESRAVKNREKAEFDTSADGTIIPDTPQPEQIEDQPDTGGVAVGRLTDAQKIIEGLPETPSRMWTPRPAGRPPKGVSYDEELFQFIREVYGDHLKDKSRAERWKVRCYIFNKNEALYDAITSLEGRGGKLPPDIDMPSDRKLLEERFQKAVREGLHGIPRPERRAVVDKLGRIARQEQAPKG